MRTRFRERPAAQTRGWVFMASVGIFGILAVAGLAYIGFNAPNRIPGRTYYNVNAEFTAADNLTAHSQIRVNGQLVGQVLDPRIVDGKAVMQLQLDPVAKPVYTNATIEVRPRSAVGVRYVDLKPGKPGPGIKELAEDGTIPASQTKTTLALDEVLSTFDTKTQADVPKFFQGLGEGFMDRGETINDLIKDTPPMLRDTQEVLGTVAARQGAVRTFIRGNSDIATAADPVRLTIRDGFKPQKEALDPFAQEREPIHRIFNQAPGAFTTASRQLPAVTPFLRETAGFAKAIRPALQAGPRSFGQASALLKESRPGLRNAESTLKIANKAVDPTLKLLDTVRPVLPELDATMTNSTPVLKTLGDYGCDVDQFGEHWGSMMHYGNGDGGALRFNLQFGPESIFGQQVKNSGSPPAIAVPEPCTAPYEGK